MGDICNIRTHEDTKSERLRGGDISAIRTHEHTKSEANKFWDTQTHTHTDGRTDGQRYK